MPPLNRVLGRMIYKSLVNPVPSFVLCSLSRVRKRYILEAMETIAPCLVRQTYYYRQSFAHHWYTFVHSVPPLIYPPQPFCGWKAEDRVASQPAIRTQFKRQNFVHSVPSFGHPLHSHVLKNGSNRSSYKHQSLNVCASFVHVFTHPHPPSSSS